ncbi:hypothetical protein SB6411_00205 [Klebsiella spallanzanii]|uniref:Uncharacterized protein n=1 Tax=Klebsiella spallanzanii TaxID=2587528 RepID=A0ABY6V513_9ENTR|nr:hypothetical protein [Klebsiella spallanzanii]VUS22676.1 hypothetical protein SB6411_00205 [Klebsiella spallanzanii]
MSITSIKINGVLPVVPGMKTLDDFVVTNWFSDFPVVTGTNKGGYYFSDIVTDITLNSFNNALPLIEYGTFDNSQGYISVNSSNYLDTSVIDSGNTKIIAVIRRPPVHTDGSVYFVADFSTASGSGIGVALGIGTDGNLRMAAQNAGGSLGLATVAWPASIAVGDLCAVAGHAYQGQVYAAVYNPATLNYVGSSASLSGTKSAGTKSLLIGKRPDGNTSTTSIDIKSAVLIDGQITGAEQLAVMQYMLAMN